MPDSNNNSWRRKIGDWLSRKLYEVTLAQWITFGAVVIVSVASFLAPVRWILFYRVDSAMGGLSIALFALIVALSLSLYGRRVAARNAQGRQSFAPIEVILVGLPLDMIWTIKRPVGTWLHSDSDYLDSYLNTVIDGPICGTKTGKKSHCRHRLNKPPQSPYGGDSWTTSLYCQTCDSGEDGKKSDVDDTKLAAIRAVQRYVGNGGELKRLCKIDSF